MIGKPALWAACAKLQLITQHLGMSSSSAKSAYAQGRVGFHGEFQEREHLVRAGIKGAHHHTAAAER